METSPFELDTNFEAAAELLDREPTAAMFALSVNQFRRIQGEDKISRRGVKKLVDPKNARCLIPHLPAPGDHTHCALRGDFVLCDLIPAIIDAAGRCGHLFIATLGMSAANADTLAALIERGLVEELTIVCSHYFRCVDKTSTFRTVQARLEGKARLIVTRSHAKIICMPMLRGDFYVMEGSANLRSSDNTEQLTIFNDSELDAFHREWLGSLPQ